MSLPILAKNRGGAFAAGPAVAPSDAYSNAYSVSFDGIDDYMDCGDIDALDSAANFSLSLWANFVNFSETYNMICGSGTGTADRFLLVPRKGPSDAVSNTFEIYFCGASAALSGTSLGLGVDTWYHVAIYKNGANMSLYIDNSLEDSISDAPTSGAATGSNFAVGRGIYSGAYSASVIVDELAIWNSDQSSNRTAIYNSGAPGDLSSYSPSHWWRMGENDDGTGTTVTDQGNGGNNGTLTNGPTFSTDVPS